MNVFSQIRLHTDDPPRFYQAMDSVLTTSDTTQQEAFIQRLYVDKASTGLKELMELRGGKSKFAFVLWLYIKQHLVVV